MRIFLLFLFSFQNILDSFFSVISALSPSQAQACLLNFQHQPDSPHRINCLDLPLQIMCLGKKLRRDTQLLNSGLDGGCLFVPSLSSCHKKAAVALYFGRILTRLEVSDFQVFRLLL